MLIIEGSRCHHPYLLAPRVASILSWFLLCGDWLLWYPFRHSRQQETAITSFVLACNTGWSVSNRATAISGTRMAIICPGACARNSLWQGSRSLRRYRLLHCMHGRPHMECVSVCVRATAGAGTMPGAAEQEALKKPQYHRPRWIAGQGADAPFRTIIRTEARMTPSLAVLGFRVQGPNDATPLLPPPSRSI